MRTNVSAQSPQLVDSLLRERILRSRRMSPEEKLLAGQRLFEYACEVTRAGIRNQYPNADESRVSEILRQRLAFRRSLEEQPFED
jgi:hypothetical protein